MNRKNISFSIIVTDSICNVHILPKDFLIDYTSIKNATLIVFENDKKIFESNKWQPKDNENIYIFFKE